MDAAKIEPPILDVQDLTVEYRILRKALLQAVSRVSFQLRRGETLGLVGESGCGKSSLARAVMQLPPPKSGRVFLNGEDLTRMSRKRLRRLRPAFQIVFQDAVSALNPGRIIGKTIAMPLRAAGRGKRSDENERARKMMHQVGLDATLFGSRPFELSGGQCQRVQIARALITRPRLLICDEAVSSLDVSVQAQILNLLEDLRLRYRLSMLFISHDLAVVKNISDRVVVMYLGKICEIAPSESVYRSPAHPYTKCLIEAAAKVNSAAHAPEPGREALEMPSPSRAPTGCRFRTRCFEAAEPCSKKEPIMETIGDGHQVACHYR